MYQCTNGKGYVVPQTTTGQNNRVITQSFLICVTVTPKQLLQHLDKQSRESISQQPIKIFALYVPKTLEQFSIKTPPRARGEETGTVPLFQCLCTERKQPEQFHCKSFLPLLKGRTQAPSEAWPCVSGVCLHQSPTAHVQRSWQKTFEHVGRVVLKT